MKKALFLTVGAVLLLWAVFSLAAPAPLVEQPIAYNHNLHVEEEGLVCTDCHVRVEEFAVASLPEIDICSDCHDSDPLGDSPEEARLIEYLEAGTEVPWQQVYSVPDHVYFSHRRHVVLGEIECEQCHGDVAGFTLPVQSLEMPLSMNWCMSCHKDQKVTNDCLTCHR